MPLLLCNDFSFAKVSVSWFTCIACQHSFVERQGVVIGTRVNKDKMNWGRGYT
jgi:hypothetical protein